MQANDEFIYKLATVFADGVTSGLLKEFHDRGIEISRLFTDPTGELRRLVSLPVSIDPYMLGEAVGRARSEMEFILRHDITPLFLLDEDYPWRLYDTPDAPKMLFKLGDGPLDSEHNVSMVGTRRCTQAGLNFCGSFVSELAPLFPDLCIISGLALGIDTASHTAALHNERPTVAVLAHGLDTIYPAANRNLAREIINRGGVLLTEYPSGTKAYRGNFLERNRIVAALSDALVVVESDIKGGAMSTANTAFSYSREVFALPGRISDIMSRGCNHLILKNKARILTSSSDFIEEMDWRPSGIKLISGQRCLFPELEGDAKIVYDYLRFRQEACSVDNIHAGTTLPVATVLSVLGELEFDGIVMRLPGNRYEVAG